MTRHLLPPSRFVPDAVCSPPRPRTGRRSVGGLSDDYNGDGRIDFADVVWLFNHL